MYDPSSLPAEYRYKSKAIKRIPLDVQKTDYERIKAAADAAGLPVNTWIKSILFAALDPSGAPSVPIDGAGAGDASGAPG